MLCALSPVASDAQQDLEDILGGIGTAETVEGTASEEAEEGEGTVAGQVFDRETGTPVSGVTVIIEWPAPADGSPARQEVRTTDADGAFAFPSIPAGSYRVSFIKAGYRASAMTDFAVLEGEVNRADFPLPRVLTEAGEQVMELEAFVVEASTVSELMDAIELRLESDQLVNILSAEDLSRFAASDVADALKRVAGVNIVEGQFAIIRGLEDRYSSTLFNGAVVPSPDPDRQSVQLDLVPSEIVSNLVVTKSFAGELPSNSSGGSIDILTTAYPESPLEIKLKGGSGFNERAAFGNFLGLENPNPVGKEENDLSLLESEFGLALGGTNTWLDREVRYRLVANREIDKETSEGFQEGRAPAPPDSFPVFGGVIVRDSGDLATGDLSLTAGKYNFSESERVEQDTGFVGLGLDLDPEGRHKLDLSLFYTRSQQEIVQLRSEGYFPGFDYEEGLQDFGRSACLLNTAGLGTEGFCAQDVTPFSFIGNAVSQFGATRSPLSGSLLLTGFVQSQIFERNRDLWIAQLNGSHEAEWAPGLKLSWASNFARTTSEDTSRGANFFFEPDDPTLVVTDPDVLAGEEPVSLDTLGPGRWFTRGRPLASDVDIDEKQFFSRGDLSYTFEPLPFLRLELSAGGWYERARRDVGASFTISPTIPFGGAPNAVGNGANFSFFGDTLFEAGDAIFRGLNRDFSGTGPSLSRVQRNESLRDIWAYDFGLKATLWEKLDLLGSVRIEDLTLESTNDPFVRVNGQPFFRLGTPLTFPDIYILFDRIDNPNRPGEQGGAPIGAVFNHEVLNIDVDPDFSTTECDGSTFFEEGPPRGCVDFETREEIEAIVNGKIDEKLILPSASFSYRPVEGLTLRGSFSITKARPSFREIGYYVSVEPGTDDQTVGNPQLNLSKVTSYDGRVEYLWGDDGDLVAASVFYKTIKDPIESFVVRNQFDFESGGEALFRTFFNNPNQADLLGVEFEFRKNLGFLRDVPGLGRVAGLDIAQYFTIGGNFTYIDATVDRTDAEIDRASSFFLATDDDIAAGLVEFSGLISSRRLFGQPEWIANADIAFDHPDWGTQATLALFGISDVLDAAGTAFLLPRGDPLAFTPDRYVDSFFQLDFVYRQELWAGLSFSFNVRNLTDSRRRIVYDTAQTSGRFAERSVRTGRDYSFSLTYELSF